MLEEALKVKEPEKSPETAQKHEEFIDLFETWSKGVDWNAKQRAAGRDISEHLPRFNRIQNRIDRMWENFLWAEKKDICLEMNKRGLFSDHALGVVKYLQGMVSKWTVEGGES